MRRTELLQEIQKMLFKLKGMYFGLKECIFDKITAACPPLTVQIVGSESYGGKTAISPTGFFHA